MALRRVSPPSSPPYKTGTPTKLVGEGVKAYLLCSYAFSIIYAIYGNNANFPNIYYTFTTPLLHPQYGGAA